MKILGLTGGVASSKNHIANIFAKKGAMVFDADFEVHQLLKSNKSTIDKVREKFPTSFVNAKIDRAILGKIVFADAEKLRLLEEIIHPEIRRRYSEFVAIAEKESAKILLLNIPLLLETQGYDCDKIIAIIAGEEMQKKRFLERPNASEEKFYQIKSKQLSDEERLKKANFVIYNDGTKPLEQQIDSIIAAL